MADSNVYPIKATADITTTHPEYTNQVTNWQIVRDTMKGQTHIKSKGETYLPMTSGQSALSATLGAERYNNYKMRARFFDIVDPAVRGLVGIAHEKPAVVEVPPRMAYIVEEATASGDTLDDLARKVTSEALQTGRVPLLVDAEITGSDPYISLYTAEAMINWKQDELGYYLAVLSENSDVAENEFSHEYAKQYRVLRHTMEAGYTVEVYLETQGGLELQDEFTIGIDHLPLAVAGAVTTNSNTCEEGPVLPIAHSAVSAYMLSADYRQSLYMSGQPTPWTKGLGEEKPTNIGADTVWHLPENGDCGYMEISGGSTDLMKQAIDDELQRAEQHGSKLLQQGGNIESADALRLRMLSQYATLQSVVTSCGEAIEQSLKSIASWLNLNPDQVSYKPNMEFVRTVELGQLSAISQAVSAGNLPRNLLYEAARQAGFTELPDDALDQLLDEMPVL